MGTLARPWPVRSFPLHMNQRSEGGVDGSKYMDQGRGAEKCEGEGDHGTVAEIETIASYESADSDDGENGGNDTQ